MQTFTHLWKSGMENWPGGEGMVASALNLTCGMRYEGNCRQ